MEPKSMAKHRQSLLDKIFFIAFIAFPYELFDTITTAICIMTISLTYIVLRINRVFSFKYENYFLLVFLFMTATSVLYSLLFSEYASNTVLRQSNHFIQFFIYTHFFVMVMSSPGFLGDVLQLRSTKLILIISFAVSILAALSRDGYVHDVSPNGFALLISMLFFTQLKIKNLLFFAIVLTMYIGVVVSSGRATPALMMAAMFAGRLVTIPSILVKAASLFTIVFPIFSYLIMNRDVLYDVLVFDHNTYVRAEFMRAAFQELRDNLFTGVGFGPSWRPYNYDYVTAHSLLSNPDNLAFVSNHHSVFDTAYRLGAPLAICFVIALFIIPKVDKLSAAIMLMLSIALSLNAWFEAQPRLYNVALFVAILLQTSKSIASRQAFYPAAGRHRRKTASLSAQLVVHTGVPPSGGPV